MGRDSGFGWKTWASSILEDLDLSLEKVFFTLSSVESQFERLGITPDPHTPSYVRVWREIQSSLRDGSTTFLDKLQLFKDHLLALVDILKGSVFPVQLDSLSCG